jgi:hypothetical protein
MEKITFAITPVGKMKVIKIGNDGSWQIKIDDLDVSSKTDENKPAEVEKWRKRMLR